MSRRRTARCLVGHAYVDYQIPQELKHPYPIVMIHGCCSAGSSWNGTPDGRDGWAQYFLSKGYAVYIMDQVGRGRSAYVDSAYGPNNPKAPKFVEREFIAYEKYNLFPQAHLHTQWPGPGTVGDPMFDQFQAMMEPDFKDRVVREKFNRPAGVALLDKIGPAILMAHSQAGIYAWGIANDRPNLVKGMIMVEAAGSPFHEIANVGAPDWFKDEGLSKPWGFTRTPVDYDPPLSGPSDLVLEQQEQARRAGPVPLLAAEGAGAAARQAQRHSDHAAACGGLVRDADGALRRGVSQAGRRRQRFRQARRPRHPRQRSFHDAGEEQPADRRRHRRLAEQARDAQAKRRRPRSNRRCSAMAALSARGRRCCPIASLLR